MVSATDVFDEGKYNVRSIILRPAISASRPPRETLVVSPTTAGTYSVLLFFHGFKILNDSYGHLLRHISSHGYIVVAPQLYRTLAVSGTRELEIAAEVTNWLTTGLQFGDLPAGVNANVQSLALAGHSRGGKTAFAMALGYAKTQTTLKPLVLLGLDPVAGSSRGFIEPNILTFIPHSFKLDIPVTVIGTGLGPMRKFGILPACAPEGKNHVEFFTESKPPCTHIVTRDYGHMDMLDDGFDVASSACESGTGDKSPLRRCLGGIIVAVLRASLEGKSEDFKAIVDKDVVAPVTLDPIITYIEADLDIKARL